MRIYKQLRAMQTYYIYFMTCKNGKALYVGVTNNLEKRVIEHRTYDPKSFTSRYNCHKLVYYEEYSSIQEAIAREKQIKSWKRWHKDQLISSKNPELVDIMPA